MREGTQPRCPPNSAHGPQPPSVGLACDHDVSVFLVVIRFTFLVTSAFINSNSPVRKTHLFSLVIGYAIIIYSSMDLMSFANC